MNPSTVSIYLAIFPRCIKKLVFCVKLLLRAAWSSSALRLVLKFTVALDLVSSSFTSNKKEKWFLHTNP